MARVASLEAILRCRLKKSLLRWRLDVVGSDPAAPNSSSRAKMKLATLSALLTDTYRSPVWIIVAQYVH